MERHDPLRIRLMAPMLVPMMSLVGGILSAEAGCGWIEALMAVAVGAAMALSMTLMSSSPLIAFRIRSWHWAWVAAIFFGIGVLTADFSRPVPLPRHDSYNYPWIIADVLDVETRTSGDLAEVSVISLVDRKGSARDVAPVGALVRVSDLPAEIDDRVILPNGLKRIADRLDASDSDYALRLQRKGILYSMNLDNSDECRTLSRHATFSGSARKIRDRIETLIENTSMRRDLRNFTIAMLLGDRSFISADDRRSFSDAGISHVLALSGMHVGIVAGVFLWMLFPLNIVGLFRWRMALTVPAIWGYTIISGLMPSTVRAAIMITVMTVCFLLQRKNSAWNALLLACFIILLLSPFSLYDPGLQLSFVCVASLIFFASPLNPVDHRTHPKLYKAMALILASLIATLGSAMVSAYYFESFPLLFLPVNMIVLPLLPPFIVGVLAYLLFAAAGFDLHFIADVLNRIYGAFAGMLDWLTDGGASSVTLHVAPASVALWLATIALLAIWRHQYRHRWVLAVASAIAVAALVLIPYSPAEAGPRMMIHGRMGAPEATVRADRESDNFRFPVNAVTRCSFQGKDIIVADRSVASWRKQGSVRCHYLLITRSCTDSLPDILGKIRPDTLVIHSSVRIKREKEIISAAGEAGLPVISLRKSKALLIR